MIFQQYIYTTALAYLHMVVLFDFSVSEDEANRSRKRRLIVYLHMVVLFDFSVSEDEANRSRKRRLIVKSVDMSKVWNLYC